MSLSAGVREELKTLYRATLKGPLDPDDPAYVAQVNQHAPGDAVTEIANEIDFQDGGGVCLFTGQRGTGKSTELKRLKQRVEEAGAVVFYVDLSEYLLLTKEVEISDFLFALAGAMSEQVELKFGGSPANRTYWTRLVDFLQTKVEFKELGLKLSAVEIKASLKNDPDFKRKVQEAARGHVAQLVRDAHRFIADAVTYVRDCEGDADRKVVLLVDSIERIRGTGSEAMTVYESVRNLFFAHAEHLRIPLLHLVYTVPPYLSVLAAGAGTLIGGASTRRLVSIHVLKDRTRLPDPSGLGVLRSVIAARYSSWRRLFKAEAVDKLALSSGGDLRVFFLLIRLCLPAVRDDAQLPLTADDVQPAENAVRNEMMPIPADHLTWLKCIAETHVTCLDKDENLPTLAHFLDNRLVLNYRNGSDWYDVHPLLHEIVDSHAGAGT